MAKLDLNKKKVIISGFSSGIGGELTRLLTEKFNCEIVGIARDESKALSFIKTLKNPELIKDFSLFDVADESAWLSFYSHLNDIGFYPEILINCAGMLPKFQRFDLISSNDVKRVMDVNFFSAIYSTKALMPILKRSTLPTVINVSSSAALSSFAGISSYSASKSALKSLSLCLSAEYGNKAYIGCFCPGFSSTAVFRNQSANEKDLKLIKRLSTPPHKIARKIIKAMKGKKKFKVIGYDAKLMSFFFKLMPVTTSKIITKILKKSKLKIFEEI